MKTVRGVVMTGVILSVFLTLGCSHQVKLQITNVTEKRLPVTITGKGLQPRSLGMLQPYSRDMIVKLDFKKDDLPAPVTVKIGAKSNTFIVTKEGPRKFWYDVQPDAIRRRGGKDADYEKTVDVKDIPVTEPVEVVE